MNIGNLQIEIATNIARLQADMSAAKKAVTDSMGDIDKAISVAKTAFIALGGVTSLAALQGIITSGIEAKVKLYDLSIQTGITVESLSGLSKVAKYTNTDITDIAGASNKLSKALFTQNEDSKGAAQAIKALGLNFAEFKQLSADQQFLAVAHAMSEFEDGTAKSAAAMLLYGKAGAQLLPFLKELEERGLAVGKQTTASALEAKKYEDNLVTLKIAADAWKRTLAEAVLPTLISVTDAFIDARKGADSFNIAGFAIKTVFETLGVLGANVSFVFQGVGREIGAIAAQAAAVARGDFAGAAAIRDAVIEDGKRARADLDQTEAKLLGLKSKISTAADFQRGDKDTSPVKRKQLGLDDASKPVKDVADAYDLLIKKINDLYALNKAEYESDVKLTEVQKLRVKILQDIETGLIKITPAQKALIAQDLIGAEAIEKLNLQKQLQLKWNKELLDQQAAALQSAFESAKTAQDDLKGAREQLAQYGLSTEALQELTSARARDLAAAIDARAAFNGDSAFSEKQSTLWRAEAQAIRDTADARDMLAAKESRDRDDPMSGADRAVKEYLQDVKRAGDATYGAVANSLKGLEDLTVTALSGGDAKSAAKAWVTGIITEIERLYFVKPLLASIFGNGSGGSSGGLIGSLGSLIGNYFGGGYSANGGVGYSSGAGISGGRAGGGDVSAGKNYLIGEQGPEILRMGNQGGTVVPNNAISSGARPVTVNLVNNGQPVQARSSQRETSQGTMIDVVLDAVASDISNGGRVHDATQRRFGLNPGGTTPRR